MNKPHECFNEGYRSTHRRIDKENLTYKTYARFEAAKDEPGFNEIEYMKGQLQAIIDYLEKKEERT